MELISMLSPAQTLYILTNGKVPNKELLKYTFLDLILNKALKSKSSTSAWISDKKNVYLTRGANYGKSTPKKFEIIFLKPFLADKSIRYLFQTYSKIIVEADGGYTREYIRDSEEIKPLFKKNWFLSLFGINRLTDIGLQVQGELSNFLKPLEKDLPKLIKTNPKKAFQLITQLKGNLLIFKNFDFNLLNQFDKNFGRLMSSQGTHFDSVQDWILFNEIFHDVSFDDSFFLDSFDSGCSNSDSGCSSCTSCSGCGGCGGCS